MSIDLLTQDIMNHTIFGTELILPSRESISKYLNNFDSEFREVLLGKIQNKWYFKPVNPFAKLGFLDILISSYTKKKDDLNECELKKLEEGKRFSIGEYSLPLRNNKFVPTPVHGIQVAQILARYKFDSETNIAGLFHDLFEDTEVTRDTLKQKIKEHQRIKKKYNLDKIVDIIQSVSLDKPSEYHSRIAKFIESKYSHETYAVKFADRIHNTQTFSSDEPPLYNLINDNGVLKDKILKNNKIFKDLFDREIILKTYETHLKQSFLNPFFEDTLEEIKENNYNAHLALKDTKISFSNLKGDFVLSNTYKNLILLNNYRSNRDELYRKDKRLTLKLDKMQKNLLSSCMAELNQHINHLLTFHVSHNGEDKALDVIEATNKYYKANIYDTISSEKIKDHTNYDMNIRDAINTSPKNFLQNFIDPLLEGNNRDILRARFERDRDETNNCLYELLFYMNMRNTIKTYQKNDNTHVYKNLGAKGITKQ